MKKILKLSFLTVGIALSSSLIAQEPVKKEAVSAAEKLEAPKPTEATTNKQEPAKASPAPSGAASKTESKKTDSSTGGTRMAITEQGMPKKSKKKTASATAVPSTPTTPTPAPTPPKN